MMGAPGGGEGRGVGGGCVGSLLRLKMSAVKMTCGLSPPRLHPSLARSFLPRSLGNDSGETGPSPVMALLPLPTFRKREEREGGQLTLTSQEEEESVT